MSGGTRPREQGERYRRVAIAVVALAWFIGFAMFSGAMGSPF